MIFFEKYLGFKKLRKLYEQPFILNLADKIGDIKKKVESVTRSSSSRSRIGTTFTIILPKVLSFLDRAEAPEQMS